MYDDDIDHVARDSWLNRLWQEAVAPLYERLNIKGDGAFLKAKTILDDYYEGEEYAVALLQDFTEDELIILEGGKDADYLLEIEALDRAAESRIDDYYY